MTSKEQGGEGPKGSSKKKGKTLPLTDFLKPTSMGNWADDDVDDSLEGLPPLPTAPGETSRVPSSSYAASSGPSRPLPDRPPYKVFIGNVPFDATEDEMGCVFHPELAVLSCHIIKHRDTQKPRGCFVEFETRDDLVKALKKDGTMVMGRPIRVDVAEDRPQKGGSTGGFGGGSYDRDDDSNPVKRRGYGFGDGGSGFVDAAPLGGGFTDRGGGFSDRGGGGFGDRRGGGGFADTYGPDRGRLHDGGFGGRGGYDDDRGPRRGGGFDRHEDRRGYGGFSGRSEEETEGDRWGHISKGPAQPPPMRHPEAPTSPSQSRERPKLTLAPRSDDTTAAAAPAAAAPSQDAPAPVKKKSNPFGDAKPVDAEAKLRELEERERKRKMEEARKRTVESDAARAAELKARSAPAPGRPANGAQHEDDSVSSTSGASTERSHQSAAPAAHGRLEPGHGGRGRGDAHRGRGGRGPPGAWDGGGRTPRGSGGGRFRGGGPGEGRGRYGGLGRGEHHHHHPGGPPSHRQHEPMKDDAGFQTVGPGPRGSRRPPAQERDADPSKHAEGPPGLGNEPSEKPSVVNKFDLLNIEED